MFLKLDGYTYPVCILWWGSRGKTDGWILRGEIESSSGSSISYLQSWRPAETTIQTKPPYNCARAKRFGCDAEFSFRSLSRFVFLSLLLYNRDDSFVKEMMTLINSAGFSVEISESVRVTFFIYPDLSTNSTNTIWWRYSLSLSLFIRTPHFRHLCCCL